MSWEFSIYSPTRGEIALETTGAPSPYKLLHGTTGFGIPSYSRFFVDAPGGGQFLESSRLASRDVLLQVEVTGVSRADVESKLAELAYILAGDDTEIRAVGAEGTYGLYVIQTSGGGAAFDDSGDLSVTVALDMVAPEGFWVSPTVAYYTPDILTSRAEITVPKPRTTVPVPLEIQFIGYSTTDPASVYVFFLDSTGSYVNIRFDLFRPHVNGTSKTLKWVRNQGWTIDGTNVEDNNPVISDLTVMPMIPAGPAQDITVRMPIPPEGEQPVIEKVGIVDRRGLIR